MSAVSIATLPYLTCERLAARLLSESASTIAIIDVRGSDYIGGHIAGCINVPSSDLDWKAPELVRKLKDKETVVFHCALSQQRGPAAALRYLRERERLLGPGTSGHDEQLAPEDRKDTKEGIAKSKGQAVYVLEGGFNEWQEGYGEDERLTEDYKKDVWQFGR